MTYPARHINHADGDKSGYAFKTLWQEATNAFLGSMDMIKSAIAGAQKTEQLHDLYDIKGRQDWSIEMINATKPNNTGSNILFAIVVLTVLAAITVVAVNYKKQ